MLRAIQLQRNDEYILEDKLSITEFTIASIDLNNTFDEDEAYLAFCFMDMDADGYISTLDLCEFMKLYGKVFSLHEIELKLGRIHEEV